MAANPALSLHGKLADFCPRPNDADVFKTGLTSNHDIHRASACCDDNMMWLPTIAFSPLVKIPFLFSGTYLAVTAQSPPNPPPKREESKKFDGHKDTMVPPVIMRNGVKIQNAIYWFNFLCEASVIIATQHPTPLSSSILSAISLHPSGAEHVRATPIWLTGCTLMHLGSFIRLSCYRALGKNFTWELSVKQGQTLVTSGPYAVVRHPSYVGALTIYTGVLLTIFGSGSWFSECIGWDTLASKLFTGVCASWALGIPMMLMGRVNQEDDVLRREFGEKWEAYAERVPYRLFPFIY